MKLGLIAAAALVAATTLSVGGAADAAQGCGPGFHRGFYGACRPNGWGRGYYGGGFYGRPFYGAYHPFGWHRWGWGGWHGGWHRW